jgi:hypothetical protein
MTIRRRCADRAQPVPRAAGAARRLCEGGPCTSSFLHRSRWITSGIAVLAVLFPRLVSRDVGRARDAGTDPRVAVG